MEQTKIVKRVSGEFGCESGALAELFGMLEASERGFVAIELGEGDALKEPGQREARLDATSAFEQFSGFLSVAEVVEFDETQLEVGLGVFGHLENFLAAEFAVERVFGGASFLAGGETEMVDQESGVAEPAMMTKNFRADTFVDAADEADFRIATEQANVLMFDLGGKLLGGGQAGVIGPGGTVPDAIVEAEDVIADGDLVSGDVLFFQERRDLPGSFGVEVFIGVEREDPV